MGRTHKEKEEEKKGKISIYVIGWAFTNLSSSTAGEVFKEKHGWMKTAVYRHSLLENEKINLKTQLAFFPSLLMLGEGTEHSNNKHHYLVYQFKAHYFTS